MNRKEYMKEYLKNYRIKRKLNSPNYEKEHYKKYKTHYLNKNMIKKYGITLEDYKFINDKQRSTYLVCLEYDPKLYVDHCHKTGKVRGLLCHSCNIGLGNFKDNTLLLTSAIRYLQIYG